MSRRTIVLATGNPGKLREIRAVLEPLGVDVRGLKDLPAAPPEPEETAETFAGNARDKALYYARATGQWCLADDSGLVVDALDGAPGVRSARYAADQCPPEAPRERIDAANNRKLLAELADVPDDRRTARFVCCLALADAERVLLETTGAMEGRIIHQPRGEGGFGYDPLFELPEVGLTTAKLSAENKHARSHRGQATRAFAAQLPALLA